MTTLTEFLTARLDEDEAVAWAVQDNSAPFNGQWYNDAGHALRTQNDWVLAYEHHGKTFARGLLDHIARHDPARVLREVAAKRRVMERHSPVDVLGTLYCDGCPTDEDGFHVYELSDCPELQNLAFIWNEDEAWNQKWCPHVEGRHEEDVTEVPPARGCYTNACNRCGTGDGWHYRDRSTT